MNSFIKTLPFLIALTFLISGISKLISSDVFEQFLYGLGLFSLDQAFYISRLTVSVELILALLFAFRLYPKTISCFTLGLLFVFTIFIVYLNISQKSDDCHCFGTLIRLSNGLSILKNILLALLIILYRKKENQSQKSQKLKLAICVITGLFVGAGVNFPASRLHPGIKPVYCETCLNELLDQTQLKNEKKIVCFISTACKYCKLMAQRLTVIAGKTDNNNDIVYFLWDDKNNPEIFFETTYSYPFSNFKMDVISFLKLTKGTMPLLVLYNQGKVEQTYRYSDMDESKIIEFLNK